MLMVLGGAALVTHMSAGFLGVANVKHVLELPTAIALQTVYAPCNRIDLYETHWVLLERCCG